jgi:hypothetical protein
MPCSLLKENGWFTGTWHLQLQDRRINQARNQHESRLCLPPALVLVSCLSYSTLEMEVTKWHYIPEDRIPQEIFAAVPSQLCFRVCLYEGPRKLGGPGTEWDKSAFSLC